MQYFLLPHLLGMTRSSKVFIDHISANWSAAQQRIQAIVNGNQVVELANQIVEDPVILDNRFILMRQLKLAKTNMTLRLSKSPNSINSKLKGTYEGSNYYCFRKLMKESRW